MRKIFLFCIICIFNYGVLNTYSFYDHIKYEVEKSILESKKNTNSKEYKCKNNYGTGVLECSYLNNNIKTVTFSRKLELSFDKPDYNLFDLDNLINSVSNTEINKYLENSKTCSGILNYNPIIDYKKSILNTYSRYIEKINLNSIKDFQIELEYQKNIYNTYNDLYSNGTLNVFDNTLTSPNTDGFYNGDLADIEKKLRESYYLYKRAEYGLNLIEKDINTFDSFINKKCSEELEKISNGGLDKQEKTDKVNSKLQEKFDNIDNVLPIFYKKYPKKILGLLSVIEKMKIEYSKNSDQYLLLEYLANKIKEIED